MWQQISLSADWHWGTQKITITSLYKIVPLVISYGYLTWPLNKIHKLLVMHRIWREEEVTGKNHEAQGAWTKWLWNSFETISSYFFSLLQKIISSSHQGAFLSLRNDFKQTWSYLFSSKNYNRLTFVSLLYNQLTAMPWHLFACFFLCE